MSTSRDLISVMLSTIMSEDLSSDNLLWSKLDTQLNANEEAENEATKEKMMASLEEILKNFYPKAIHAVNPDDINYLRQCVFETRKMKLNDYDQVRLDYYQANLFEIENEYQYAIDAYQKIITKRMYGLAYQALLPLLKRHANEHTYKKYREKMLLQLPLESDNRYRPSKPFLDAIFSEKMLEALETTKLMEDIRDEKMHKLTANTMNCFSSQTTYYNVDAKPFVPSFKRK